MALTKIGKEGVTGISNSSNATAITIDSSENVGIGVASMTNKLVLPNAAYFAMQDSGGSENLAIRANSSNAMELLTAGAVRMTINSAGKCLLGPYGAFGGANTAVMDLSATGNSALGVGRNDDDLGACLRFFKINTSSNVGTIVGSISVASSSTTYATSSDYRLKTSVSYDWDATTRLKQLKPARFKWISDGESAEFVDGFLAHEAATVVPEAIIGDKDAVDDDGNIDPQGMDYSKVVPLLVKTIQELEARIAALEAS